MTEERDPKLSTALSRASRPGALARDRPGDPRRRAPLGRHVARTARRAGGPPSLVLLARRGGGARARNRGHGSCRAPATRCRARRAAPISARRGASNRTRSSPRRKPRRPLRWRNPGATYVRERSAARRRTRPTRRQLRPRLLRIRPQHGNPRKLRRRRSEASSSLVQLVKRQRRPQRRPARRPCRGAPARLPRSIRRRIPRASWSGSPNCAVRGATKRRTRRSRNSTSAIRITSFPTR